MRKSSIVALIILSSILIVGVYGVVTTTPTEFAYGDMDVPVLTSIYHGELGNISDIQYPIFLGSNSYEWLNVFPVFSEGKSGFMVPGAYVGYLTLGLISSEPVNISIYKTEDFIANLFWDVPPYFSASNVTKLQAFVPYPDGLSATITKILLDNQLFPSQSLTATTASSFVVSIENGGSADAIVALNPLVSGLQIVQNPLYLLFWALLLFSSIFIILTLLSEAVPEVTSEDIYERNIIRSGFKIALREPIRIVLPFIVCLIPIMFLFLYNIWTLGTSLAKLQTMVFTFSGGIMSSIMIPFPFDVLTVVSPFLFFIPLFLVAHFVVYSFMSPVYFEATGEEKRRLEMWFNPYLLISLILSVIVLYADFLVFSSLAETSSYIEIYNFGIIALALVIIIPPVIFALSFSYTLRAVSASADRDNRNPGEIVKRMWRSKTNLFKIHIVSFFLLIPGLVLGLIGATLLNPFSYPLGYFYSPIVESSMPILVLSGSLIFSILISLFFTLPPILHTLLYFRLKKESPEEQKW